MARNKIDYGIDLGTTNSAICRMEQGVPTIIKASTRDTMPSCVSFTRKQGRREGATAYSAMNSDKRRATKTWRAEDSNTYVEFKRTMGTDKAYLSKNMERSYSSEELSSYVLQALRSFVTDEDVKSVVITVPAKFTVIQKTATMKAAKMAGFERCELLQEPIAASMAYGLTSSEKDGYWMVFDFGGGTFDAALLKVEDGIMQVFDTEGDNYLGGKNLDYALVDDIIIPYLKEGYAIDDILADPEKKSVLRDAMKTYTEEAKNQLSFQDSWDILSDLGDLGKDDDGEELELDLTITQEQAFNSFRPYFQKAVDICKTLLQRNNMDGSQLNKIILVGGPTHCPLIKDMLREQITPNVDSSIDPMTAVATGAALYASTLDAEVKTDDVKTGTVMLTATYESTSVETSEWVTLQLNKTATGSWCPDHVFVKLTRSDNTWSSDKSPVDVNGNVFEVSLNSGRANSFVVRAYDDVGNNIPCFPNEITIIQGTKVGAAPLPYHIGIEVWDDEKKRLVFQPIEGLEKNKPLPATGKYTESEIKTTSVLRPDVATDRLVVPIYQADDGYVKGASSKLYEHVADVIITGSDVDNFIPEGSLAEITVHANSSEMMTVDVFFPSTEESISKDLKTDLKERLSIAAKEITDNFSEAQRNINSLTRQGVDTSDLQEKLNIVKKEAENSDDVKGSLQHQKEVMREIEKRTVDTEFDRVEKELKALFKMTEEDLQKYGTPQTAQELEQLRAAVDLCITKRDTKMAKDVIEQVRMLDYRLAMVEYFIAWISGWNQRFDTTPWKDKARARQLLNQAIGIINGTPTADALRPIIDQLFKLLPDTAIPKGAEGRLKIV